MKSQLVNQLAIAVAAIVTLVGINTYMRPAASSLELTPNVLVDTQYQYATLTLTKKIRSTAGDKDSSKERITYVSSFDFGVIQYYGQSNISRDDSYRVLINRLGGHNSQIDIHTLMNAIGGKGWRLVETQTQDTQVTRVFIK